MPLRPPPSACPAGVRRHLDLDDSVVAGLVIDADRRPGRSGRLHEFAIYCDQRCPLLMAIAGDIRRLAGVESLHLHDRREVCAGRNEAGLDGGGGAPQVHFEYCYIVVLASQRASLDTGQKHPRV